MIALLFGFLLRPLLATPLRLAVRLLPCLVVAAVPDLLLRRYLDAELPRAATAGLLLALAAAALFLRSGWRRHRQLALARGSASSGRAVAARAAFAAAPSMPPSAAEPKVTAGSASRWFALWIAVQRGPDGSTRAALVVERCQRVAAGPGRISRRYEASGRPGS